MKLMNYMNLNRHPVQLSFHKDRSHEFVEIYHAHQGMEILYVHEGRGHIVVDKQIFELRPGALFYFRPYQLHRIRVNGLPEQPYIRSLFVFEPAALEAVLGAFPTLQSFLRQLYRDPSTPQQLGELPLSDIEGLLHYYSGALERCPPEQLLEEQLFFLSTLLQRIRSAWVQQSEASGAQAAHVGGKVQSAAEQMLEWLEDHYTESFELDQLAQAVHLTPNHVSSLFRRSVGSTITEYITARRIRQACWLLRTTDLAIKEVGEAVGYPNFSYFCQAFKRHVGQTPYRFKREEG
ncbi:AraC family transcriptional regulator [Paenibacillus sp. YYML68]|uniref:AraC family transcriptional regulator n=1 Tax=Paenibacillus sp. YYML68 TaxID=2909250 RepID=UPI00248FF82D|nr:AraC family transcriptional regulator [Paenibacillus sp. YYML68]